MAQILRYEYTISNDDKNTCFRSGIAPLVPPHRLVNTNLRNGVIVEEDPSSSAHGSNPSSKGVLVPQTNPSFPAPLFHTLLLVFFAVHIPQLILALPQFRYLYKDQDPPGRMQYDIFRWLAILPPPIWAAFDDHFRGEVRI